MRFGLKCIVVLAVLYRAILLTQGGPTPDALSAAALSHAASVAQATARREIATRLLVYCSGDPAACVADAARLTSLVAATDAQDMTSRAPSDASAEPRYRRHGAVALQAR